MRAVIGKGIAAFIDDTLRIGLVTLRQLDESGRRVAVLELESGRGPIAAERRVIAAHLLGRRIERVVILACDAFGQLHDIQIMAFLRVLGRDDLAADGLPGNLHIRLALFLLLGPFTTGFLRQKDIKLGALVRVERHARLTESHAGTHFLLHISHVIIERLRILDPGSARRMRLQMLFFGCRNLAGMLRQVFRRQVLDQRGDGRARSAHAIAETLAECEVA